MSKYTVMGYTTGHEVRQEQGGPPAGRGGALGMAVNELTQDTQRDPCMDVSIPACGVISVSEAKEKKPDRVRPSPTAPAARRNTAVRLWVSTV